MCFCVCMCVYVCVCLSTRSSVSVCLYCNICDTYHHPCLVLSPTIIPVLHCHPSCAFDWHGLGCSWCVQRKMHSLCITPTPPPQPCKAGSAWICDVNVKCTPSPPFWGDVHLISCGGSKSVACGICIIAPVFVLTVVTHTPL